MLHYIATGPEFVHWCSKPVVCGGDLPHALLEAAALCALDGVLQRWWCHVFTSWCVLFQSVGQKMYVFSLCVCSLQQGLWQVKLTFEVSLLGVVSYVRVQSTSGGNASCPPMRAGLRSDTRTIDLYSDV